MSRDVKYIGMDVHKEAVVIAVRNSTGQLVMESIVETKASSLLQFIHGLQGELHVTWEEGTWAAWLYDLLKPHVHEVLVCNPRRNALLKEGSKNDRVDARKLSDLLRTGMLRPVYHGEHGLRTLRELARSYQTISQDLNRVMNLGQLQESRAQLIRAMRSLYQDLGTFTSITEESCGYKAASNTTITTLPGFFEPDIIWPSPPLPNASPLHLPTAQVVGVVNVPDVYAYLRSIARSDLVQQLREWERHLRWLSCIIEIVRKAASSISLFCGIFWQRRRWFLYHGARPPKEQASAIPGLSFGACLSSPIAY